MVFFQKKLKTEVFCRRKRGRIKIALYIFASISYFR